MNFINDEEYFDAYIEMVNALFNPEIAEYTNIAPLEALISNDIDQASCACCVTSLKFDPVLPLCSFLSDSLINCCKIFSEIINSGNMFDYTILLREDLFANLNPNDQIEKLAHESFHIIAGIIKRTYTRNQIDEKALEIAEEFKRYHYDKGTLEDFLNLLETIV